MATAEACGANNYVSPANCRQSVHWWSIFAAMGISGFGKAASKRQLDPKRFDKGKRDLVSCASEG